LRWATYKRLRALGAALQERWLLGMAADLGRVRVKQRWPIAWGIYAKTALGQVSPPSAAPHLLVEYDELDDALRPPAAGWVSANFLYSTSAGASASWRNTEPRWGGGPAVELQQGSGGRPIPVNAYPTLEDARNIRQPLQEVLHLDAHVVGPTAVRWCSHADQAPARV